MYKMVLRYSRYLYLPTRLIHPLTGSSSNPLYVQTQHYLGIFHGRKIPLICQEYNFVNIVKTEFLRYSNQLMYHGNRSIRNILNRFGFQWSHGQQPYQSFMRFIPPSFCTNLSLYHHGNSIHACYAQSRNYSTVSAPEPVKQTIHRIQEDFSSLKSKRVVRRKRPNDIVARQQEYFDVVAFATAEEYNLEALKDDIDKQGLYEIVKLPDDAFDTLHVEAKYKVNNEPREIFFFREGSVVFWNMQDEETQTMLSYIRPYQSGSYEMLLTQEELEKFEFTYTGNKTVFTGGEIHLRPLMTLDDRFVQQLEMFAFSNALSLSVKLAIWESSLEKYVNSIEWVLQDLKNGKKIRMSEAAVLRKAGELFTLSHLINLSSDLLDTPDFYWDRDNLEKIYRKTCNHLNISRRTRVMNEKLSQCVELTELLRDHLKDKHHTRLELMIIFLILIEVVFQVFHLLERYYWGLSDEELENKSKTVNPNQLET